MWRRTSGTSAAEQRPAQIVTIVGATLFTLLLSEWRPWRLFERAGFSGNFYDVQAQAFLRGRLAVPADVADIEGFLIDGKTYLYYGPFLAIARLPAAVFGSWTEGRLTRLSMIVAFVALCTITFHLAKRTMAFIDAPAGAPWRPALLVAAVACSPVLALAGSANVYNETELWAFVLMLATFVALLDLLADPTTRSAVVAGSLATATVLTRVSVGLGAVVAVVIVSAHLWRRSQRPAMLAAACALTGVVIHITLNLAKFGSLFDLPGDRQVLTMLSRERAAWFADHGNSFFGLEFVPTTIVHYLRPDAFAIERLVPFVRFGPRAHEFGSAQLESNTPASSLTASATLLMVMAVIGLVLAIRHRHRRVVPFVAGSIVAAGPTLAIGFIANRYLVDLLPGLVVLGAVATASFHPGRRAIALVAVGALTMWGVWINASLATWLNRIEEPGFTAARYRIDGWVFGDPAPSVERIGGDPSVPRDGVVGIDGPCDGLYIASGGNWVMLELADGVRRVQGTFDPAEGPVVLDGDDGLIEITPDRDGESLVASYSPATVDGDRERTVGTAVAWDGGRVDVEVVSDPRAGGLGYGLALSIDDDSSLREFVAPDLSTMKPGAGFVVESSDDGGVPICASLARRGS
jgi:hypothetical protein